MGYILTYIAQTCQWSCIPLTCQCSISVTEKREGAERKKRFLQGVTNNYKIHLPWWVTIENLISSVSHFIHRPNLEVYR